MRSELPPGWVFSPLGAEASIVMGNSPPGDTYNDCEEGVPLLNGPTDFGPRHPDPATWTTAATRYSEPGDVLFCVRGSTTGRMNRADQRYGIGRGIAAIRGSGPADTEYICATITALLPRLLAVVTGSTFPNLSSRQLADLSIPWPSERERHAIARVIRLFDDKIDSNQRLASLLEETAATVFRARFLDFVGIEEFEESDIGRIPKGWRLGVLSDLCQTRYGYTASATADMLGPKFLRVKDINKRPWIDWSSVPFCVIPETHREKYALHPGDIVVARMADPGKAALVNDEVDAVCASYLVRLRTSSREWSYFVHRFMRSSAYDTYLHAVMAGSVQKNINARTLVATPLAVPPEDIVHRFGQLLDPLYQRQASAVRESAMLANTRDALLPKLISGDIRVPDTTDPAEVIGPAAERLAGAEA